jgi:hypothetical protein
MGMETETFVGSGPSAYPGMSFCDAKISKHTNILCNSLQQRTAVPPCSYWEICCRAPDSLLNVPD